MMTAFPDVPPADALNGDLVGASRRGAGLREAGIVFVVQGTKKFRDRVRGVAAAPDEVSTTALGNWFSTVMFWRPHVALFVSETTLLPVLVPFAPAVSLLERFPATLADVLCAHGVDRALISRELAQMRDSRLVKTTNRSVVGVMNEFAFLAEVARDRSGELLSLSLQLAATPCGPLSTRHVSPDRELMALVADIAG